MRTLIGARRVIETPPHTGLVYAVNGAAGTPVAGWPVDLPSQTLYNIQAPAPAVANGVVYLGGTPDPNLSFAVDPGVWALNASTGAVLWTAQFCGYESTTLSFCETPPAVAYGYVFTNGPAGLHVFNGINGSGAPFGPTITDSMGCDSTPAVANGALYFGCFNNNLYMLNALNGQVVWQYTTGGAVESSPAVANGIVYAGSDDGKVYAFEAAAIPAPQRPSASSLKPDFTLAIMSHD